jgi:hypothetical protein
LHQFAEVCESVHVRLIHPDDISLVRFTMSVLGLEGSNFVVLTQMADQYGALQAKHQNSLVPEQVQLV